MLLSFWLSLPRRTVLSKCINTALHNVWLMEDLLMYILISYSIPIHETLPNTMFGIKKNCCYHMWHPGFDMLFISFSRLSIDVSVRLLPALHMSIILSLHVNRASFLGGPFFFRARVEYTLHHRFDLSQGAVRTTSPVGQLQDRWSAMVRRDVKWIIDMKIDILLYSYITHVC